MSDKSINNEKEGLTVEINGVEVKFVGTKQDSVILKERILDIIEGYKNQKVFCSDCCM